jgi:hypothetical protein
MALQFFAVLHNHWFTALPEDITRLLKTGPSSNSMLFFGRGVIQFTNIPLSQFRVHSLLGGSYGTTSILPLILYPRPSADMESYLLAIIQSGKTTSFATDKKPN